MILSIHFEVTRHNATFSEVAMPNQILFNVSSICILIAILVYICWNYFLTDQQVFEVWVTYTHFYQCNPAQKHK